MKKIGEKYKTAELKKHVKTLTDFLKENKLHYRLVVSSPENEAAFEWHELTNAEWITEIVTSILDFHEENGTPVGAILKLVEVFVKKAQEEGDKND